MYLVSSLRFQTCPSLQKSATAQSTGHSVHPAQGESSQCSHLCNNKRPISPLSAGQRVSMMQGSDLPLLPHNFLPSDPGHWNVEDVYVFICSLPGGRCSFVHLFTSNMHSMCCLAGWKWAWFSVKKGDPANFYGPIPIKQHLNESIKTWVLLIITMFLPARYDYSWTE